VLPLGNRFTSQDLIFFTRQTASMLTSGLTLMQALLVLKKQAKKKAFSDVVTTIITDIEAGSTLSESLKNSPRIFKPIYISLVKAGEKSGLLDNVLTRLAENLEKEARLRSQIQTALYYPTIVAVMMVIVIFVMMLFVVPQLNALYDSLAIELPLSTRILVGTSNFFVKFWPIMLMGGVGGYFSFARWFKTPSGKRTFDRTLLRIPLLGRLLVLRIITEFTRTFGLLVGSGEPVVSSLTQAKDVIGNSLYTDAVATIAKQVEKGIPIGEAFNASPLFPPLLIQMVRVGEQTGKLDENLGRASEYFEREVEQAIKILTTALEPIIMAVLGIGVAFLLLAVITPIYQLTSSF
jgi:type II secretory pathway component PulF